MAPAATTMKMTPSRTRRRHSLRWGRRRLPTSGFGNIVLGCRGRELRWYSRGRTSHRHLRSKSNLTTWLHYATLELRTRHAEEPTLTTQQWGRSRSQVSILSWSCMMCCAQIGLNWLSWPSQLTCHVKGGDASRTSGRAFPAGCTACKPEHAAASLGIG